MQISYCQTILRWVLLSLLPLGFPSVLRAQELPTSEDIRILILAEMPPFWDISGIKIVASENVGDVIDPRANMRFEANVQPREALYVKDSDEGPFAIVIEVERPESIHKIYGTAEFSYSEGKWDGFVNLENSVRDLGVPADFFGQPIVAVGSDEGSRRLELLRDQSIDRLNAEHSAEIEDMEQEHERRIAQVAGDFAFEIERMEQGHARVLAETSIANRTMIEELGSDLERQISDLQRKFDDETQAIKAERSPEFESARSDMKNRLVQLAAENALEIERLVTKHAQQIGELIATQQAEISTLETRLEITKSELETQLSDAAAVMVLQANLEQQLFGILEKRSELDNLFLEAQTTRESNLENFLGVWDGTVSCAPTNSQVQDSLGTCPAAIPTPFPEKLVCYCPPNSTGSVWGTKTYSTGSSTCASAIHAGVLEASNGGAVVVVPETGQQSYAASNSNGIASQAYGPWQTSFRFESDPLAIAAGTGGATEETIWAVSLELSEVFGTALRGTFMNLTLEDSPFASSKATFAPGADVETKNYSVSLDSGKALTGTNILDLHLTPEGNLIGYSRDARCKEATFAQRR